VTSYKVTETQNRSRTRTTASEGAKGRENLGGLAGTVLAAPAAWLLDGAGGEGLGKGFAAVDLGNGFVNGGEGKVGIAVVVNAGVASEVTLLGGEDELLTGLQALLIGFGVALGLVEAINLVTGNTAIRVVHGDPLDTSGGGGSKGVLDQFLVLLGSNRHGGSLVSEDGVDNDNVLALLHGGHAQGEDKAAEDDACSNAEEECAPGGADLVLEVLHLLNNQRRVCRSVRSHCYDFFILLEKQRKIKTAEGKGSAV